jgi:hypothetical protein
LVRSAWSPAASLGRLCLGPAPWALSAPQLAEVEEISIGFTQPDASTGSTPVWGGARGRRDLGASIRGRRGGWYRRLGANPDGELGDRAHIYPVRVRPVQDAGTLEAVTGAYAAKYGDSP